jgi:hypothetical protein
MTSIGFWLCHDELAVGVAFGQYLRYLDMEVGSIRLPHGVMEFLAVSIGDYQSHEM